MTLDVTSIYLVERLRLLTMSDDKARKYYTDELNKRGILFKFLEKYDFNNLREPELKDFERFLKYNADGWRK